MPTDPLVRQMSPLQLEAMEYALNKIESVRWLRLEKILGTFWEYSDVAPVALGENGEPVKRKSDNSKLRMPLATILNPTLYESVKKILRPPEEFLAALQRTGTQDEAHIVDMADVTTKEAFIKSFHESVYKASRTMKNLDRETPPKSEK